MTHRPRVSGKFIWIGDEKFIIKGITYGTFGANSDGDLFPDLETVRRDFALMRNAGINTIRTYTLPPQYVMDEAAAQSLYVIPGIYWEGRRCIFDNAVEKAETLNMVKESVLKYKDHPALLAWCVGNEIPPDVVRWHGVKKVERFLKDLYQAAKDVDPDGLVTYASYPPTEYLDVSFFDIISFNIYLLREQDYRSYLVRLQVLSGDKPLLLSETGSDSLHRGEEEQARFIEWQVRGAFEKGLCGLIVFAWTDEWVVGGEKIEGWAYGVVDDNRRPKKALESLSKLYKSDLYSLLESPPQISVVVAAYNAQSTIKQTLESLEKQNYPTYETIIVDDGSSDHTTEIIEKYPVRLIKLGRSGLSTARNTGIQAATGEIVAFTDSDCIVDPDWLFYLAVRYAEGGTVGVGGPNIVPGNDGWLSCCIDRSPGMPRHVLMSPDLAEHIPGCNMSFYRSVLLEVGMFDPIYWAAGDDVDICWRILDKGYNLAFAAGAMVLHHRRPSVRAYLRQQRGYGKAEVLLARRHPYKFSRLGGIRWNGSIYAGLRRLVRRSSRIHQGIFGTGQFQSIYYPHWAGWLYIATTPEWYTVTVAAALAGIAALFVTGPLWEILLGFAGCFMVCTAFVCAGAAYAAELSYAIPRKSRLRMRTLIGFLHTVQPLYRTYGRFIGARIAKTIPTVANERVLDKVVLTDRYWSSYIDRPLVLSLIHTRIREENYYVDQGTGWENWDLKAHSGCVASAYIMTVVENQTVFRFRIHCSVNSAYWIPVAAVMVGISTALAPTVSLSLNVLFLTGAVSYARWHCYLFENRLGVMIHEMMIGQGLVPIEPSEKKHRKFIRWIRSKVSRYL